jgi:hypothetical protein
MVFLVKFIKVRFSRFQKRYFVIKFNRKKLVEEINKLILKISPRLIYQSRFNNGLNLFDAVFCQ